MLTWDKDYLTFCIAARLAVA